MTSTFDAKAAQWDEHPERLAMTQRAAEAIGGVVRPESSMRALEFGCGTGTLSFLLRDRLGQIVLCDASSGMLEVARKKIDDAAATASMSLLLSDLETGPLPEGKFDLIYTAMALHHVIDTDALLQRFAGLLNPAGRLALIDLVQEDGSFHQKTEPVPHNGFAMEELERQVKNAGLRVDSCRVLDAIERDNGRSYPRFILLAHLPELEPQEEPS
ncbi:TPA: class I SAM-dependent methyltransferase [Candidatus Sumerlaeota bacterium]|jgi:ubiquinone/menaquinone biosynthesis C-methylase UbiE|nr:class I SAM-dependent methyltransferase [Candidatus Sumerlaeota bacterium]